MSMTRIDLHVHTTASDGTLAPSEVVALAKQSGLAALSITDHDTGAGLREALAAGQSLGVEVIPGIEISVGYKDYGIHLLGYFLDPDSPALQALLDWVVSEREDRNRRIAAAMRADGVDVTLEALGEKYPGAVIGRPHFAQALVDHGLAPDISEAFVRYLNKGCVYFRRRTYIPMDRAFAVIHAAGGKAVMAHPLQYRMDDADRRTLIGLLRDQGAVGMECLYTGYDEAQTAYLRGLAAEYGLCVTGGSDFHGARKSNRLGEPPVPYECLEELRTR